jgi:hypothetical protein
MSSDVGDDDQPSSIARGRYEGEDVSPTTKRELNGWFAYPIAAEVFAVVATGTNIQPPLFYELQNLHTVQVPSYQLC